jgi:D-glycero-beta-D-manno-heptose 1-phosphate adenylyltransferase
LKQKRWFARDLCQTAFAFNFPFRAGSVKGFGDAGNKRGVGKQIRDKPVIPVNFRTKIIPYSDLPSWRQQFRGRKQLVVTNGCFDLLHLGHVTYLENARNLGDLLLVGVNGDSAVRGLKGAGRPLNTELDRAGVLAALEAVAAVCIFPDVRATNFLVAAQPDIYAKGGDYTLETLDQDERRAVESQGGRIVLIPFVPGKSTTTLLKRILG